MLLGFGLAEEGVYFILDFVDRSLKNETPLQNKGQGLQLYALNPQGQVSAQTSLVGDGGIPEAGDLYLEPRASWRSRVLTTGLQL